MKWQQGPDTHFLSTRSVWPPSSDLLLPAGLCRQDLEVPQDLSYPNISSEKEGLKFRFETKFTARISWGRNVLEALPIMHLPADHGCPPGGGGCCCATDHAGKMVAFSWFLYLTVGVRVWDIWVHVTSHRTSKSIQSRSSGPVSSLKTCSLTEETSSADLHWMLFGWPAWMRTHSDTKLLSWWCDQHIHWLWNSLMLVCTSGVTN